MVLRPIIRTLVRITVKQYSSESFSLISGTRVVMNKAVSNHVSNRQRSRKMLWDSISLKQTNSSNDEFCGWLCFQFMMKSTFVKKSKEKE